MLNSRKVKSSSVVRVGDRLEIAFPRRVITVEICTIDEVDLKRGASSVSVIEERRVDDRETT